MNDPHVGRMNRLSLDLGVFKDAPHLGARWTREALARAEKAAAVARQVGAEPAASMVYPLLDHARDCIASGDYGSAYIICALLAAKVDNGWRPVPCLVQLHPDDGDQLPAWAVEAIARLNPAASVPERLAA